MKNVKQLVPNWSQVTSAQVGTVVHDVDGLYRIKTDSGLLPAQASASCLLSPEVGDRVLLTADNEQMFITAILVKSNKAEHQINIDGPLVVNSESVQFNTDKQFDINSKTLNFQASLASFKFGVLNQIALKMSWIAEKLDMTASKIHRSAKQEFIVVNQQFERVTETKNTQAGRWIQRVHKQWIARSERTTLTAKKEMKLDGERIDLG